MILQRPLLNYYSNYYNLNDLLYPVKISLMTKILDVIGDLNNILYLAEYLSNILCKYTIYTADESSESHSNEKPSGLEVPTEVPMIYHREYQPSEQSGGKCKLNHIIEVNIVGYLPQKDSSKYSVEGLDSLTKQELRGDPFFMFNAKHCFNAKNKQSLDSHFSPCQHANRFACDRIYFDGCVLRYILTQTRRTSQISSSSLNQNIRPQWRTTQGYL